MNQSTNASVSALRSKGMFLRQIKKYRPRTIQKTIEQTPMLRTMDQLYDCFYEYSRNLLVSKPVNPMMTLEKRDASTSELRVLLPLATDSASRLKMADSNGHVRLGRLLEAIDIVAPCSCYMLNREDTNMKWFANGSMPRMFVTAKIHPIPLSNVYRISPYQDIYLNGKVSWTGENKVEATVSVQQNGNTMLSAKLVFASLNGSNTSLRYPVNQLIASTTYESELLQRRHVANTAQPTPPQKMALEKQILKSAQVAMADTSITTTTIAYPEHENPYGSVFGGYLVRQGIETAEMCAKLFAKAEVKAISLDNAEFLDVIEIGSILKFNAYVCDVQNNIVKVCSQAEVFNEDTNKFEVRDRFLFTFEVENDIEESAPGSYVDLNLPQVVPHNMQEFIAQWRAKNSPSVQY